MLTHQNAPDQQKAKAVSLLLKLRLWASSGSMLVVQWYWYTVVYLQRISLNSVNRRRVQSMLYNWSAGYSYLCCWWLISQPWKIKLICNIQMKTSVKNTCPLQPQSVLFTLYFWFFMVFVFCFFLRLAFLLNSGLHKGTFTVGENSSLWKSSCKWIHWQDSILTQIVMFSSQIPNVT